MKRGPLVADVVIVGAGLAGAATAYELARRGIGKTIIVEREDTPGRHASGRNAAMVRQVVSDLPIAIAAIEGARFLREPPPEFPRPVHFRRSGSLLLASDGQGESLRQSVETLRGLGVHAAWLNRADVTRLVPATEGGVFSGGMHCANDGVVDVAALLEGYLSAARAAGMRIVTDCRVIQIHTKSGRIDSVETEQGRIVTPAVVNAAGAWASEVGHLAGAASIPLQPYRRHLMTTAPLPWVDPMWPFVWDITHQYYFRPECGGLLLSACDEEAHVPGEPSIDSASLELLATKLTDYMPRLDNLPIARVWAGLRTLVPDGRFIIGRDPQIEGFTWCAGLGGHGVTASAAVGRLAAEAVLGKPGVPAYSPERFR